MKPADLFALPDKVALVTGGSGILGQAITMGLVAAGARVVVMGRRDEPCQRVADVLRTEGGQAIGIAADVLDRTALEQAKEAITEAFGPVDILINGAGGNQAEATTAADRSFFELDLAGIRQVFEANLTGAMLCSQVFGREMAERGAGTIINIASMAGLRPLTRVVAYSAAKAALVNFTQWLAVHMAQEYHPLIRVNAIAPGFFLTEQNRFLLTDPETGGWTARGASVITHTPTGRFGTPEDLVGATLWLASPASSFVTGIVVPVDGGFSAFGGV